MPRKSYGSQARDKPLASLPRTPARLGKVAAKEYKKTGQILIDQELILEIHVPILIELAEWAQVAHDAAAEVEARGATVMDDLAGRSWVQLRQKAFDNMWRIKTQFGLTPSGFNQKTQGTDKQSIEPGKDLASILAKFND